MICTREGVLINMSASSKRILNDQRPMDHRTMCETLSELAERYSCIGFGSLGSSILGREIPLLSLGSGPRCVLYVGAHHGMEWLTTTLLLRFVEDFCIAARENRTLYKCDPAAFCNTHTLYVVPMLNPDGVEYQIHGVAEENPMRSRLISMNHGSEDFSNWQANARGVDLNHNYDAGFAEYKQYEAENDIVGGAPGKYSGDAPETEPEVAYLCNFIRFCKELRAVLTFHTQGEEIFYKSAGITPKGSSAVAKRLSLLSGYHLSDAKGSAAFGGLTDWCIQKQGLPCFTLECGKGKNPLPTSCFFPIYANLRELLFTFPLLY